jgi:hypothetical protein
MVGRFRLDQDPVAPPEPAPAPAPLAAPRLRPPAPVRAGPVPRTALARKIEPALDDGWEEF